MLTALKLRPVYFIFFLLIFGSFSKLFSQTFSNSTITSIPDNGNISIPITVSGLSAIDTTNFGLESIAVNINHDADQELTLELQSPDGTTILLAKNVPGSNFTNTEFNASANLYVDFGTAPYQSDFRPIQDLSLLNNFQNPNGTWKLMIIDNAAGNIGSINDVSITFGNQPAMPLLTSSNLPIIKINTNGQEIIDDPKIVADMYIIDNGSGQINYSNQTNYNYSGKIGIEIRGHSSQQFPKKQYGFETRETDEVDDSDVSLLGLPKQSDWVLSANYSDKTLMRNVLTYELARELGQYASRTIYCEVLINNEYRGVFVLEEKIKKDKKRVNIEKLTSTDIAPPNVTGGYIFSIDKLDGGEVTWNSKIPGSTTLYQFVYPKDAVDIQPEQNTYLQSYVDSFEEALNGPDYQDPVVGFRNFAEENSFMDYFIINELSRNIDGYRISSYFSKARLGKILAGPVWDYDIAWGNADYYDGFSTNGYAYSYPYPAGDYQVPFWWGRLMSDIQWKQNLICRFNNLRPSTLSQLHLNSIIDSLATELQDAQQRNFIRWNIIGQYVWPNPQPVPASFAGEVNNLKSWISGRLGFLDAGLGGCSILPVSLNDFYVVPEKSNVKLKWVAHFELSNDYYAVERSTNNQQFVQIGRVNADKSATNFNYSYDDRNPVNGTIYYRLRQVDLDGRFSYSKVISVNFKNAAWNIYPNRLHSQLTIISPYNDNQNLQISIYNMQGQRLSVVNERNSSIMTQDVSRLAKGNYILEITSESGNKIFLHFFKD